MIKNNSENILNYGRHADLIINAQKALETARSYHEQYLIKGLKDDLESAVFNYIEAIKFNPAIPEAYYRLATLLLAKGEITLSTAIEQCKSAVALSPDNPNARIYMGYFLEMAKKYDEAEIEFKEAIKLNPLKSARPRISLATMLLEKIHEKEATTKDISQLLYYIISGSLTVPLDRSSIKMIYKNFKKNLSVLSHDIIGNLLEKTKNYSMAIKIYDAAAELTGKEELFYQKIGDLSIKNDEPEIAIDAYKKALEANPRNKDLLIKVATITQTYFEEDKDNAIDCYTKLIELDNNNPKIYYELGHLYLSKNEIFNAINAFNLAIEKDIDNPFYHNALAYALVQAEQFEDAVEHYQIAINQNPDSEWTAIVCQALGMLHHKVFNNSEAAIALYQSALILDKNNPDINMGLGDIYTDLNETDLAIKSYCDAITKDATDPVAYNKCAMALWQKNYLEEAIIAYNKAINLKPDYYIAYNNLGVIYLDGIGNTKEAIRLFKIASGLKENYAMAYFNLGRAYQQQNNEIESAKNYQKALDINIFTEELDEEEIKEKLHSLFEV